MVCCCDRHRSGGWVRWLLVIGSNSSRIGQSRRWLADELSGCNQNAKEKRAVANIEDCLDMGWCQSLKLQGRLLGWIAAAAVLIVRLIGPGCCCLDVEEGLICEADSSINLSRLWEQSFDFCGLSLF